MFDILKKGEDVESVSSTAVDTSEGVVHEV
jgi:hypothetical protein